MSCRVNYVIIDKEKKYKIYDGKYGGSLVYSFINSNPTVLVDIIKDVYDESSNFHGDCISGALVDFSCNELIFFGHSSIDTPISVIKRLYIPYIKEKWLGWKVEYADLGINDFEKKLSMIDNKYIVNKESDDYKLGYLDILTIEHLKRNFSDITKVENIESTTEAGLITIKFKNNFIKDYITKPYSCNLFYLLQVLGNIKNIISYLYKTESVNLPNEKNIMEGVYIDYALKKVYYWSDYSDLEKPYNNFLNNLCQDWDIIQHYKGFPYHIELSGRNKEEYLFKKEEIKSIFLDYFKEHDSFFNINDILKYY